MKLKFKHYSIALIVTFLIPIKSIGQTKIRSVGIETGLMKVIGDVDSKLIDGRLFSLKYRHSINQLLHLELKYKYGESIGLEQNIFGYTNPYYDEFWFPNNQIKTRGIHLEIGVRKLIYDKVEFQIQYGPGISVIKTKFNVYDENNQPYKDILEKVTLPERNEFDISKLQMILDDTFESCAISQPGSSNNTHKQYYLVHNFSISSLYVLNNKWRIGIKSGIILTNDDSIDGIRNKINSQIFNITNDIIQEVCIVTTYNFSK